MLEMDKSLHKPLLRWYASNSRDLPWRRDGVGPWPVLVSEIMLQQTPVVRVLPAYDAWLARWPTAARLAADPPGEAVRMWGRLGYPRRALRLHGAAREIVGRFAGCVPSGVAELESLPGVGAYTARAIAAFAFGQRQPVVDVNVRRVVARAVTGRGSPSAPSTARDQAAVLALLPDDPATAARVSVALMELGALVCVARTPQCTVCPLETTCAWRQAGSPAYDGPAPPVQRFAGTDRQVRGLLLSVLREASGPVAAAALDAVWHEPVQRSRALNTLIADGLVAPLADDHFALPS
jgi:A/G-specific adenine glycosylase